MLPEKLCTCRPLYKQTTETRTKINDCGLSEQLLCMNWVTCAATFCSKICVNCLRLDYNDRLTTKNILVPQSLSNDRNDTKTTPQQNASAFWEL